MMPQLTSPTALLAAGSGPDRAGPDRAGQATSARATGSGLLLALFFLVVLLPIHLEMGGQRIGPVRIFLLLTFIPFGVRLFAGKAGRFTAVDGCLLGFVSLMVLTFLYHHGMERFPYAMVQAVEVYGGYLAGRMLVRSLADYQRFIRYFLVVLLVLLPFAVDELLHSRMLISEFFSGTFDVVNNNQAFRFGLARVQVVFPHSILYGLFCSLALASVFYLYQHRLARLLPYLALVIAMTVMALSSAPIISVALQLAMILWDKLTRGAWKLLAGLFALVWLLLDLVTNRGAVVIFVENMTLDPATGWWRIHIWTWGTRTVLNYPLLGIGLNDWVRPFWLSSSVDNFWLLMAMRHGLPAVILLLLAFGLHCRFVMAAKDLAPVARMARTGYAVTLVGLIFTLVTVHVWDSMAVFTMFFLGIGAVFYTAAPEAAVLPESGPESGPISRSLPHSRFPARPDRSDQPRSGQPQPDRPRSGQPQPQPQPDRPQPERVPGK